MTLSELKGHAMLATDGNGMEIPLRAKGFAVFGGKVNDVRLARTGRVDIYATGEGVEEVDVGWRVSGPV